MLASLSKINLESWIMRTDALLKQFAEARREADKHVEPKIQHINLSSGPLKTEADIEAWLAETRGKLLAKIATGPIVIG